ncbi:hypothetical protein AMELA_G00284760 [Ameiurus melas]|uniref:Coiled-coil domain-containing protein 157 n=1 Tax=Ameiurus melas TaxID=219545 RepID=A0A7J5ZI89_AMEME|nr:hypothetical protein AMELA_G00284760 [Ameiurus melas]
MSHLLGAGDCVESLRRDVIDLQGALVEVFSRTGPVRFRSWKFPDKESCDLDLVQLLEQYDYVEGEEEFNQHSHVVLLELVIDRLLLLLQSFNAYTEQMLGGPRAGDCGTAGGSVCVGLVVKRYWSNLIQFSSQQRQQRMSSACRTEPSSSSSSSSTHADPRISSSTSQRSAPPSSPSHGLHTSPPPRQCRSVSCQTLDSALVPCDACAGAQATLQDSAHAVASLCQALGLSCSLWNFLQAVEETLQLGRLSACDLALWAREQQRDLGRIQEHVTHVLEKEEKHRRDEELKTLQEEMGRGAAALEVKISELKGESELQRETRQGLEREVRRLRLEEVRWKETEEKKRNLELELSDTQKLLDKERAKYHSTQRQHEATALKQQALLERVDALVQQCEDAQSRLEECEDEKAELTDTLAHTTQERNTLQERLSQQESDFLSLKEGREQQRVRLRELEECVSGLTEDLQQAEERERILVAFPELNRQHTTPQSTGDVLCDMEQQLKVNSIRIRVLEQENASLNKTLERLKHTRTLTPSQQSAGDQTPCPASGSSEVYRRESAKEKQIRSSPSFSAIQHQTLRLSRVQDAEETYMKLRQTVLARSAGLTRRRK